VLRLYYYWLLPSNEGVPMLLLLCVPYRNKRLYGKEKGKLTKHKSDQDGNSIGWDSDTLNVLILITCFYSKGSAEMSHFYSAISSLRWATFDVATSTNITSRQEIATIIAERYERRLYVRCCKSYYCNELQWLATILLRVSFRIVRRGRELTRRNSDQVGNSIGWKVIRWLWLNER